MEPVTITPIVEGHGEVAAILPLIHNVISSLNGIIYPIVSRPYRVPWGTTVNRADELEHAARIVLQEGGPSSRILVLLDGDGNCPADLGPRLLQRLVVRFSGTPISVCVADWEYESWFVASAESIAEHVGASLGAEVPDNIEQIQNPKAWLGLNVLNRRYSETGDQASFSGIMNVDLARHRSHSFDRFCLELERLLT